NKWTVLVFDPLAPAEAPFRRLPGVGGCEPPLTLECPVPGTPPRPPAPRFFNGPENLAVSRHNLYVADTGNHRVQVFDLNSLALRAIWTFPKDQSPTDVAVYGDVVYVLAGGRVCRWRPGESLPSAFLP